MLGAVAREIGVNIRNGISELNVSVPIRGDVGCRMGCEKLLTEMKNSHSLLTRLRRLESEDRVPMLTRSEIAAIRDAAKQIPAPIPPPSRKNQFLVMVFSGALMRDITNNRTDGQAVARAAIEIPEICIPQNVSDAAALFLRYFYTNKGMPHKWMLMGAEHELSKLS